MLPALAERGRRHPERQNCTIAISWRWFVRLVLLLSEGSGGGRARLLEKSRAPTAQLTAGPTVRSWPAVGLRRRGVGRRARHGDGRLRSDRALPSSPRAGRRAPTPSMSGPGRSPTPAGARACARCARRTRHAPPRRPRSSRRSGPSARNRRRRAAWRRGRRTRPRVPHLVRRPRAAHRGTASARPEVFARRSRRRSSTSGCGATSHGHRGRSLSPMTKRCRSPMRSGTATASASAAASRTSFCRARDAGRFVRLLHEHAPRPAARPLRGWWDSREGTFPSAFARVRRVRRIPCAACRGARANFPLLALVQDQEAPQQPELERQAAFTAAAAFAVIEPGRDAVLVESRRHGSASRQDLAMARRIHSMSASDASAGGFGPSKCMPPASRRSRSRVRRARVARHSVEAPRREW